MADLRQRSDGVLLVPVLDDSGAIQSLQRIYPDGSKRFLVGGKIQGGHFVIHGSENEPLAICEGYATGASIYHATGWTVYVAFSANNLQSVALAARKKFPEKTIIICADSDETGRKKGEEAAKIINGRFAAPVFTTGDRTDFNDLHQTENIEAVRSQLEAVLAQPQGLMAVNMDKFLSMEIPARGYLLSPILPVQGIGILYAPRGVGKTFAALSVAVSRKVIVLGNSIIRLSIDYIGERLRRFFNLPPVFPPITARTLPEAATLSRSGPSGRLREP